MSVYYNTIPTLKLESHGTEHKIKNLIRAFSKILRWWSHHVQKGLKFQYSIIELQDDWSVTVEQGIEIKQYARMTDVGVPSTTV